MPRIAERNKLHSRIKQRREKLEWSMEDVAKEAGIPYVTYSKIESWSTLNPSAESIVRIARALGVKVEHLTEFMYTSKRKK